MSDLEWFKSYLSHGKQTVKVGHNTSKELEVEVGVTQRSVLGLVLFLIFINDLNIHIKRSEGNYFADDTMIYSNGDNFTQVKDKLQSDATNIEKCFLSNNVYVNKSGCMLISSSQRLRLTLSDLDVTMYCSLLLCLNSLSTITLC